MGWTRATAMRFTVSRAGRVAPGEFGASTCPNPLMHRDVCGFFSECLATSAFARVMRSAWTYVSLAREEAVSQRLCGGSRRCWDLRCTPDFEVPLGVSVADTHQVYCLRVAGVYRCTLSSATKRCQHTSCYSVAQLIRAATPSGRSAATFCRIHFCGSHTESPPTEHLIRIRRCCSL